MSSYQFNAAEHTILIVDDVPDNLRVLSSTPNEQGYRVRCARDGLTALMTVKANPPDLILLDVNMPGMNAYEGGTRVKPRVLRLKPLLILLESCFCIHFPSP
ncbi:MAG TPA: response regulator [Leptolyngbyaceae cyanobacterium]